MAAASEITARSQPNAVRHGVNKTPGAEREPAAISRQRKIVPTTTKA